MNSGIESGLAFSFQFEYSMPTTWGPGEAEVGVMERLSMRNILFGRCKTQYKQGLAYAILRPSK
jgi:hypothetical protein